MTRLVQFANNAVSTLAAGITNSATSMTVAPGDGAKFPALSGSQYFMATLVKATGETEVVKVTASATDTFTIARAQEQVAGAATAYAFSAGDRIEMRLTANTLAKELDRLDAAAFPSVALKSANYSVVEADIHNLIRVDSATGARTITLPTIASLTDDFDILIAKVSNDLNIVTVARSSTDTINGATSYTLTAEWSAAWLIADRATNTWTAISTGSAGSSAIIDTFTPSNSAGPFTLTADPGSKNNTAVYVGGVYQQKSTYTLTGTSLTLGGNTSEPVEVCYSTPLNIGVPGDGTVNAQKLASPLGGPVNESQGANIASASTVNLNSATGNYVHITGTTAITAFTLSQGFERTVVFDGVLTLTNSANLILPGAANITTAANDSCVLRGEAGGVVRCVSYTKYNGGPVVTPSSVPVGTSIDFTGPSAPAGYLLCPTSPTNISRTTYAALFAAIGTSWGAGDGSTTFGMPYFPADYASAQANGNLGSSTKGKVLAHTHVASTNNARYGAHGSNPNGAFYSSGGDVGYGGTFSLTTNSTGGAENLAAAMRVNKCVKF